MGEGEDEIGAEREVGDAEKKVVGTTCDEVSVSE